MAEDLKLNLSAGLPGEQLATAIFNYLSKIRESSSKENIDTADRYFLSLLKSWNNFWVEKVGWPGEKW